MLSGCRGRTSPSLGNIAALGVKRGRRGEIRPGKRETERIIKREKENEVKEGKGTAVEEACLTDLKNHQ